jgi:hypothetical protein
LTLRILLVAPGVAVHELGHWLLCQLSGVAVRQVVLFRIGSPAGFVTHAAPRLLRQQLAIASGPLFLSTLLALSLFQLAARLVLLRPTPWGPTLGAVVAWLGWSIALEAWPSTADAQALARTARVHLRQFNVAALMALPLAWLLLGTCASRRLGGHWMYAALLTAVGLHLGLSG